MNNSELRNFTENLFYWDLRRPIVEKIGLNIDDRLWFKLVLPVTHQLINLINIAILKAINYQK